MEDRYDILVGMPKCFLNIVNTAHKLMNNVSEDISIEAFMFVEYIKEFHMNFPLRGQGITMTCSPFTEHELYSLSSEDVKNYHRTTMEEENSLGEGNDICSKFEKSSTELRSYLSLETPQSTDKPKSTSEDDKSRAIYLCYGIDTIISIIQAPYLMSKVIIRNATGVHSWLLTRHKVLDKNCLATLDYNDKEAVYNNLLLLKGSSVVKDIIDEVKTVKDPKEVLEFEGEDESKKIDEDLKETQKNDSLVNIISLLAKYYDDIKIVLYIVID